MPAYLEKIRLKDDESFFIGPNLLHVWIADKGGAGPATRTLETVFLQFTSKTAPDQLLALPEFKYIKRASDASTLYP